MARTGNLRLVRGERGALVAPLAQRRPLRRQLVLQRGSNHSIAPGSTGSCATHFSAWAAASGGEGAGWPSLPTGCQVAKGGLPPIWCEGTSLGISSLRTDMCRR